MAVTPYFVVSMAEMQRNLRLSNVTFDDTKDAQTIIERAVEAARTDIFVNLGVSVAQGWAAVGFSENPTTEQGVLRLVANILEVNLVLCSLMRSLPNFFMDDSGTTYESYNDEAAFRKRSSEERRELQAKCEEDIAKAYDLLKGDTQLGSAPKIKAFNTVADPARTMGESLFNLPYPFDGNFRSTGLNPETM